MRSTFLILSVLLTATFATSVQDGQQSEELVRVSLRGTTIDVAPNFIEVVAKDIDGASKRFGERGAEGLKPIKNGNEVTEIEGQYKGILHVLVQPAVFNRDIKGFAFEEGDTIYVFAAESEQQRKRFVEKYKLTKQSDIVLSGRWKRELFTASKGHYVRFELPTTIYLCLMHPVMNRDQPGKCPTCAMPLVKHDVYR